MASGGEVLMELEHIREVVGAGEAAPAEGRDRDRLVADLAAERPRQRGRPPGAGEELARDAHRPAGARPWPPHPRRGIVGGMKLLDLSSSAARQALATGAPVFLPVNPVEYHGPHLPLHTDGLIAAGLIRDLHAALARRRNGWPLLVAADLEVGCEVVPGPGSRPVPYADVCAVVGRAAGALADLGARRVVLMTFHGSPLHNLALSRAVRLLEGRGVRAVAPFNLILRRMIAGDTELLAELGAGGAAAVVDVLEELHAGMFETSLVLHYAPDAVHPGYVDLPPCPSPTPVAPLAAAARAARALGRRELAAELDFAARGLGWFALRPFPAYTGRPAAASAAAGSALARRIVGEGAPVVLDVLEGRVPAPPPVMTWVAGLSLGGRVGSPRVPPEAVAVRTLG
jgi:creatinine amidohydrolase